MSRANSLEPALAPHVRLRNRYRAPQCLAQLIADQPLSASVALADHSARRLQSRRTTKPVEGSRINRSRRGPSSKSNIPLTEPASASDEFSNRPKCQLSSMNRSSELWSVVARSEEHRS